MQIALLALLCLASAQEGQNFLSSRTGAAVTDDTAGADSDKVTDDTVGIVHTESGGIADTADTDTTGIVRAESDGIAVTADTDTTGLIKMEAQDAGENLLDKAANPVVQTDSDSSMNQAVQAAVSKKSEKSSNRVTLEEVMAVQDEKIAMESSASELANIFTEMMASYKQCNVCKSDCTALQFKKWKVHTKGECQKNCKINVCKEATEEEVAQFEQERQEPPKYATSQFSSYIQDFARAHSHKDLVNDDEGQFDVVWEEPGDHAWRVGHLAEEIRSDPVEQLRAMDKAVAQKSSEEILKLMAKEVDAKNQGNVFVPALQ